MRYVTLVIKVLVIFAVILLGYYFIYLLPHKGEVKEASSHYSNLVQNRTAYVNLTKLDSKSPSFDIQKSNLVDIIKKTNAKGLEKPINEEERRFFEKQNEILDRVFATDSYEEGVAILKSDESIKLLIDQSNLIDQIKKNIEG